MGNYFFLMSSLPSLVWEEEAQITLESFSSACADNLDPAELDVLNRVYIKPPFDDVPAGIASRFAAWDTCLRNALLPSRAAGRDYAGYVHHENDVFSEIPSLATAISGAPSPGDAEKWLDTARWEAIDLLLGGESFNLNSICAYKLKLMLMGKYHDRTVKRGQENLDAVLAAFDIDNK